MTEPAAPVSPGTAVRFNPGAFVAPVFVVLMVALAFLDASRPEAPGSGSSPLLPAFSLTERSGRTITDQDLRGKPFLASFVFTRCSGPCPRVTAAVAGLERDLAGVDVRFVSVTVDPTHDTPEVLRRYAEGFQVAPAVGEALGRWLFVTGPPEGIVRLVQDGFHLPVLKSDDPKTPVGEIITHSTKLALVTASGRLDSYFDSLRGEDLELLKGRARDLASLPGPVVRKSVLPLVNAGLNSLSALFLLLGYLAILGGRVPLHRALMFLAFAVSAVFLACYVAYHVQYGSIRFPYEGWYRGLYLGILLTHVLLAIPVAPLALATIRAAVRGDLALHRRLARITFPIWLYVSVSGIAVYLLLYELKPQGGLP